MGLSMAIEVAHVSILKSDEQSVEIDLLAAAAELRVPATKTVALAVFVEGHDKLRNHLAGGVLREDELARLAGVHPRAEELAGWRDVLMGRDGGVGKLAQREVEAVEEVSRRVDDSDPELGPRAALVLRAVFKDRSLHAFLPAGMYFRSSLVEVE
jgi:hypothetical protein